MIGYIKGIVEEIFEEGIILEQQGIGYCIKTPTSVTNSVRKGQNVKVYTHLYVREDQLSLFGFLTASDLDMFEKLIMVNGVGPKAAIGILSTLSVSALMMAIVSQDAKAISKAPGIGAKTAQKLILELKDKVAAEDILYQEVVDTEEELQESASGSKQEAYMALVSLGYDHASAVQAVAKVEHPEKKDTEEVLKEALKFMLA